MFVKLRSVREDKPGEKWQQLFEKTWPFYQKWFLSEGAQARPGYLTSISELEKHMPEIVPIYHQLVELAGSGDFAARYLSMYSPPPYMSGCSQLAWTHHGDKALIRNYDYGPEWFEGVLSYTNWLKPVMGVSDCSWGLLDGMNKDGLAVSLTFGGRKTTGVGFGIPLILRYILETCSNITEAADKLYRLPVHMPYNVTAMDTSGHFFTAYLSPDRPAVFVNYPIGTNHQQVVEWPDYAAMSQTVERQIFLEQSLYVPEINLEGMIRRFLHPPLRHTAYEKGFGTLYTSVYNLNEGSVSLHWPNRTIKQSWKRFTEDKATVNLSEAMRSKLA